MTEVHRTMYNACNPTFTFSMFLYVSIALFIVWAALILFCGRTRKEQLIMSVVGLVLAPAILLIVVSPESGTPAIAIAVEDWLFAFSFFGVAAVAYEAVLGKRLSPVPPIRKHIKHPTFAWAVRLIFIMTLWSFISVTSVLFLEIPQNRGVLVGALLIVVYMIAARKDLLLNALVSGLCMAGLVFLFEQLVYLHLFPGVATGAFMIYGQAGRDLFWSLLAGSAVGPLYEYVRRLKTS